MQKGCSFLLFVLLLPVFVIGRDIYVATNGAGGGDPVYGAWANAASNIQWAVNVGENGDTVWISNGTYYLTNQVTVNSNVTICGNRGEHVVVDGNSANRCFYFTNTVNTAGVLSNLFITRGNTNGNGGGVYMYSGAVLDCVLSNNSCPATAANVFRGGGMFFYNNGTIQRCTFIANVASSNGGGIYLGSGMNSMIQRCSFINNNAYDGGGLYLYKSSNLWVDACLFLTNTALNDAGGLFAASCINMVVTGCDFICNVAATAGGGIKCYVAGTNNLMTHCTISSNVAVAADGGGLFARGGWTLTNLFISNNIAFTLGGGISLRQIDAVRNCIIARNRTLIETSENAGGGGMYVSPYGNPVIQDCIIEENKSYYFGGGVYFGIGSMINCLIRNNVASGPLGGAGGGVRIGSDTSISLINCTIVSNYAQIYGGGLYNPYGINVENCIIYNNAGNVAGQSNYYNISDDCTNASFSNCCFAPAMAAAYTNYSANNITANPQFVNWEGGNYRLSKGSPCVNTGVNRDWMTGAVDLDSRRRVDRYSGIVDMGCYEYVPSGMMFGVR